MGDTHITGRHLGGDTHITSDMCAGIHISRGYTYHCDTGHLSEEKELLYANVTKVHGQIAIGYEADSNS